MRAHSIWRHQQSTCKLVRGMRLFWLGIGERLSVQRNRLERRILTDIGTVQLLRRCWLPDYLQPSSAVHWQMPLIGAESCAVLLLCSADLPHFVPAGASLHRSFALWATMEWLGCWILSGGAILTGWIRRHSSAVWRLPAAMETRATTPCGQQFPVLEWQLPPVLVRLLIHLQPGNPPAYARVNRHISWHYLDLVYCKSVCNFW